jgi:hypothetical protein
MPAIVGIAAIYAAVGAGLTGFAAWAGIVAIAALSFGMQFAMMEAMKPDTPQMKMSTGRGHLLNQRSHTAPLPLVYGECRLGVNIVYAGVSGTNNKYLHLVCAICEGPVDSIIQKESVYQIWLNDKLYTEYESLVYYEFFNGTSTQNVCSTLHTVIPSWNDPLRNTAYLYIRLEWDRNYFQGIPNITLEIKGLKVYNPATTLTEYSNNPALCIRDYLTRSRKRGGMQVAASRIDDTLINSAKTYYDNQLWTVNIPLIDNNPAIDDLQQLLNSCRSDIIYSDNNKYKLKYRDLDEESSVMSLTEDDVVENSLRIQQTSIFDRPNSLKVQFINPDKKYIVDDHYLSDNAAITSDGDIRESEIRLLGITNEEQLQKISNYFFERMRVNKEISFVGRSKLIELEPHDVITLTHSVPGWTSKLFRVTSSKLLEDGNVQITAIEENSTFYDDTYNLTSRTWYDTNLLSPMSDVPSVTNVSDAEETYYYRERSFTRWRINFSPPAATEYPFWSHAEIWIKIGSGAWQYMTTSTSGYILDPVEEGITYQCKMVSVSIFDTKESFDYANSVSKSIIGVSTSYPSAPDPITCIATGDSVSVLTDDITDPDVEGYEIRYGGSWTSGLLLGFYKSAKIRLNGIKPGTFTFWVASKNNAGLYSQTKRSGQCTVFYPAGYVDKNTWSWDFTTGYKSNSIHETHLAQDSLKCDHHSSTVYATGYWSQSGLGSFDGTKINDGNFETACFNTTASAVGSYLRFDHGSGLSIAFRGVDISISGQVDCTWKVQYSDNGSSWTDVQTGLLGTNQTTGTYHYTWADQGAHRYWQLYKTDAAGDDSGSHTEVHFFQYATAVSLSGKWWSPIYDLGSVKTVRVWGDFLTDFSASTATWAALPDTDTWANVGATTLRWYELFLTEAAGQANALCYWGETSPPTNEVSFFQILAPEFTARYVKVYVELIDPDAQSYLYLYKLNMKAAYWV